MARRGVFSLRHSRSAALAALLLSCSTTLHAAGPAQIAAFDRSLYPDSINAPESFDRASRLEILAFTQALTGAGEAAGSADAKASVDRWRVRMLKRLAANFALAQQSCGTVKPVFCETPVSSPQELAKLAQHFDQALPPDLAAWYSNSHLFHVAYVAEQQRLAAYFPRISSEIDQYDPSEIDGTELPDKVFQLSFDDGPTAAGGTTDSTLAMLKTHDLHAFFFMLGNALEARRKTVDQVALQGLYSGQCAESHGRVHQSHQKILDWKESIDFTSGLLQSTFPSSRAGEYFRPPYGQRLPEAAAYLAGKNTKIMLWNLDSQDWSEKITAAQIPDRMLTLMLVWRHGLMLFHDIHPKAAIALPRILDATTGAGLRWQDCRAYP